MLLRNNFQMLRMQNRINLSMLYFTNYSKSFFRLYCSPQLLWNISPPQVSSFWLMPSSSRSGSAPGVFSLPFRKLGWKLKKSFRKLFCLMDTTSVAKPLVSFFYSAVDRIGIVNDFWGQNNILHRPSAFCIWGLEINFLVKYYRMSKCRLGCSS